jgi:ABC-2 type transport system permease protein
VTAPGAAPADVAHGLDRDPVVPELEDVARRPSIPRRLADVWMHRQLLRNLVRKELKVKYKNSVLGFVWTLLNPTLYLVVFSIVFAYILQSSVPYFAIFLLSGLLAWNLFSTGVSGGTTAIVGNASLVQKVWFPREILPIASVGAAVSHFLFQLSVLVGALLVFRRPPAWGSLWLLVPAIAVLLVLAVALAITLSAINVYLRDTQHLLELVLLAWFWMSAIVYPYRQVADRLGENANVLLLNPMIPVVLTFQRVIYNPDESTGVLPVGASDGWYLRNLGIVGAASLLLLLGGLWLFGRLEDNFGEEI